MPIYRYRCSKCHYEKEVICSISDRDEHINSPCDICGHEEHEPIIGKTNFTLKGKGWYKDGYNKIDNS